MPKKFWEKMEQKNQAMRNIEINECPLKLDCSCTSHKHEISIMSKFFKKIDMKIAYVEAINMRKSHEFIVNEQKRFLPGPTRNFAEYLRIQTRRCANPAWLDINVP
jgi:hypothetical protein